MKRRTRNIEPQVLQTKDIPGLAQYIKSNECKKIALMLGAGVSTAAGIPDFRSPETGLYSNLARLNLPYPEAVFDISFFRKNPVPFYSLAHELYPGKFRPTLTHSFVRLLSEKDLLLKCWTQNIDTLERRAGVPDAKIIEAHGSFASQRCVDCDTEYDDERMRKHVSEKKIARCDRCKGLVKPDIVFFGESLPPAFIHSIPSIRTADLLIIMGTSLTVHPFASLAGFVSEGDRSCPRVLINVEQVGDIGTKSDDVLLLGKCDEMVRALCRELGWEKELDRLWEKTIYSVDQEEEEEEQGPEEDEEEEEEVSGELSEGGSESSERGGEVVGKAPTARTSGKETEEDEEIAALQAEVDALTEAIEESLKIYPSSVDPDLDDNQAESGSTSKTSPTVAK